MEDRVNEESKKKFRRLRRNLGFVFAIVWVVFWYTYLKAQHTAYSATVGMIEGGASSLVTSLQILLAFITSPIGFVASHWLASNIVEREQAQDAAKHAAAAANQQRLEEENRAKRLETISNSDRETRIKNARAELILKLGSASELLELLPTSNDPDRILSINQSVRKELREIVAKYPMQDLVALISRDEVIRLKTEQLCKKLATLNIESDDATILKTSMQRSLSSRQG